MPVVVVAICLIICGGCSLAAAARKAGGRGLTALIVGSYAMRVLVAVGLFYISAWRLPIFPSLQMGSGFWLFSLDAQTYHNYGRWIAEAWRAGQPLPNPELGIEYFLVVAMVYGLFGVHPLYPALLNAWLAAAAGWLAYALGRKLFDARAALVGAALVGFWPSSFIWSGQLLKDALGWLLIFGALWLVCSSLPEDAPRRRRAIVSAGRSVGLALVVFLLTCLRWYVGLSLLLTGVVVFVPLAVAAWVRRAREAAAGYAFLVCMLAVGALLGNLIDTYRILSDPIARWSTGLGLLLIAMGVFLRRTVAVAVRRVTAGVRRMTPGAHRAMGALLLVAGYAYVLALGVALWNNTVGVARQEAWSTESALRPTSPAGAGETPQPLRPTLGERLRSTLALVSVGSLRLYREVFVSTGGHSLMDPEADISTMSLSVRYVPRALAIALLAPFPSQWFDAAGSTGRMRGLSSMDMVLLYLLLPGMAVGVWRSLWAGPRRLYLVLFVLITAVAMTFVVANLGTLFRLRLQFLLPLLIIAAAGDPLGGYRRLLTAASRWRVHAHVRHRRHAAV